MLTEARVDLAVLKEALVVWSDKNWDELEHLAKTGSAP
jgi:hypothetical protein